MKLIQNFVIAIILGLGVFSGCAQPTSSSTDEPITPISSSPSHNNSGANSMDTTGLNIHIFDGKTIGGLGPNQESSWHVLQNVPLNTSDYTITEDILLGYEWKTQTITIPNEWGETSFDAPIFMWGGDGAFLVTFNGQRLFGGTILSAGSPRRFDFPAMALSFLTQKNDPRSQGKLIYSFHPTSLVLYEPQSTFLADDPAMADTVRQHLAEIGKLK